jgi:hypothetical protein
VQIANPWKRDPMLFITGLRRGVTSDALDKAGGIDDNPDVACPTMRQQGFAKNQSRHTFSPHARESLDRPSTI